MAAENINNDDESLDGNSDEQSSATININVAAPKTRRGRSPDKAAPAAPPSPVPPQPDDEEPDEELDPMTAFLERWRHARGYSVHLTRLADPFDLPEDFFSRPNPIDLPYGRLPFKCDTLQSDIQRKMRSGGKVQLQLHNERGAYVKGGSYTGFIADPDYAMPAASYVDEPSPVPAAPAAPAQPPSPPVDPMRQAIEAAFTKKMIAAITDEPKPVQAEAAPQYSDEDKLSLLMMRNSNFLGTAMGGITKAIANAQEQTAPERRWYDKAFDAMASSPVLATRVAATSERVITRVLDRFFPLSDEDDGDDNNDGEQETTDTVTQQQGNTFDYLLDRIAANTRVDLASDQVIADFAVNEPENYAEFMNFLKTFPADAVISIISGRSATAAVVMQLPHARARVLDLQQQTGKVETT